MQNSLWLPEVINFCLGVVTHRRRRRRSSESGQTRGLLASPSTVHSIIFLGEDINGEKKTYFLTLQVPSSADRYTEERPKSLVRGEYDMLG